MKFTNKKLIIFDLDGTLIDSSPDLALAINHMLKTLNKESYSPDEIHHWVGNGAEVLVKRALSGNKKIDDSLDPTLCSQALEIFFDFYRQNLTVNTITYPQVYETLALLKEHGYRMAIASNKPFAFIEPILDALKLNAYFELYLGGDSVEQKKPHPSLLLYVCEKLNINVEDAVMVGDSKNDILAARACNMNSIGLSYGYNYGEPLELENPDVVFDNFGDISKLFMD